jgi:hypothetical protein
MHRALGCSPGPLGSADDRAAGSKRYRVPRLRVLLQGSGVVASLSATGPYGGRAAARPAAWAGGHEILGGLGFPACRIARHHRRAETGLSDLVIAIMEYVLPGISVTAVLVYALDAATDGGLCRLLLAQDSAGALTAVGILLLAVAYMLGVVVHYVARCAWRGVDRTEEASAWETYGRDCEQILTSLGGPAQAPLPGRDRPGWILLRMRLLLCQRSPECAREVSRVQAIARAARGAFTLPLSLGLWLAVYLVEAAFKGFWPRLSIVISVAVLGIGLWFLVRATYAYRWGVVTRWTIAAFLALQGEKQHRGCPRQPAPPEETAS